MKKYILFISIILLVVLSSCTGEKFEPKDMITTPENNLSPIMGKWSMEKIIAGPYKKGIDKQVHNEMEALFHKDSVVVGGDFVLEPSYRLKNVNLADYLFYNYKIEADYLGIEEDEAEVITVLNEGQYFYEFIRFNEEEMFFYNGNEFVFLKREVEEVSSEEINRYISIEKNIMRISNKKEIDTLNSGILLGIKTSYIEEETGVEKWDYKTIWIKSNNREVEDIYSIDNLLVPRKKGFYLVDVRRNASGHIINDNIEVSPKGKVEDDFLGKRVSLFHRENKPSIIKHIIYVGNDYISTEEIDLQSNKKSLRVHPMDYLEDNKPMKISNLAGEKGLDLFYQSANNAIKADTNHILEEESFGLERRNGYWLMKGRVNYKKEGKEYFKDFPIKTTPPKELVHYDELVVPWNVIKARIPEAIDAFTSPNEDIIIIVTRNEILIYPILENDILLNELGKIKLNSKDTIIMSEWGLGQYTNLWEEEFLKNGAKKVEDK